MTETENKSPPRATSSASLSFSSVFCRGPRVRQLRGDLDSPVAAGRQRTLPLQRLRPLLQDERDQQAARQAQEADGELRAG